jgi:hypothetical protein
LTCRKADQQIGEREHGSGERFDIFIVRLRIDPEIAVQIEAAATH